MPRALNLLRASLHYRKDGFDAGLKVAGYELVTRLDKPVPGDLLVCWNRYTGAAEVADNFERRGATVLVAENCPFGNDWRGGRWYSLAQSHVAMTGGLISDGGPQRWDSWRVELAPWRTGTETVILAQRSIGHSEVASPLQWAEKVRKRIGGRIRAHPGGQAKSKPLAVDLEDAREVVTWSSAAAIQALALGVPVWYEHPKFVGSGAAMHLSKWGPEPKRDDASRLGMFRRLAWGMWSLNEIKTGAPFARLDRPN